MSELYKLPTGWEWKDYKDVLINISSKPFQVLKSEYLGDGIFPIVDQSKDFIVGYSSDESKLYENKDNCVIFGDHTRQIKFVDFPFVIGADGTKILKSKNDNDIKFLYYQLLSKNIKSLGYSRHFKLVKEFNFAIPKPTEQKRIVAKLDNLFKKIDKAIELHQRNITSANTLMASTLDKTFKKLEEEYSLEKLNDISEIISGYAFKSSDFNQSDGIKSIKITNVGVKEFVRDSYFLPIGLAEKLSRFRVLSGDIVIALTRPYISNGLKIATVPVDYDKAFLNQRVASIRSMIDKSINIYIYYYLSTNNILKEVRELSKTLNQPNLSVKDLSSFKIPLPPLPIQQQTVEYLDSISTKVDEIKKLNEQKLADLKALKASILDKAFRGEL